MANNYFQFKQFVVHQDNCSMKVCTDACILGAWVADKIKSNQINASTIFDIGTGTGLLSLMFAQKSTAKIDAIEIEENAFNQAIDNFKQSPWSERLQGFHGDAKDYHPSKKYDLIISNPPFYQDDLLSPVQNKNVAKHNETLKLNELILVINKLLKSSGSFAVLLPYHRISYFEKLAKKNYFLKEKLLIKATLKHDYFRGILLFTLADAIPVEKKLTIKKEDGNYSNEFIELMKDYYLNLNHGQTNDPMTNDQ